MRTPVVQAADNMNRLIDAHHRGCSGSSLKHRVTNFNNVLIHLQIMGTGNERTQTSIVEPGEISSSLVENRESREEPPRGSGYSTSLPLVNTSSVPSSNTLCFLVLC